MSQYIATIVVLTYSMMCFITIFGDEEY